MNPKYLLDLAANWALDRRTKPRRALAMSAIFGPLAAALSLPFGALWLLALPAPHALAIMVGGAIGTGVAMSAIAAHMTWRHE